MIAYKNAQELPVHLFPNLQVAFLDRIDTAKAVRQ